MYYQIEKVLEKYGIDQVSVSKGRQMLLCEKDGSWQALKVFEGKMAKAEFLYQFGEFMKARGWHTDGLIKTTEDELWAQGVDGVVYTMHRWYRGHECEAKNRGDIMRSISALAQFHQVAGAFCEAGNPVYRTYEDPLAEYLRHNRELCRIRNFMRKKKKKNEYERLFLQCFPVFYQQCQQVGTFLEQSGNLLGTFGICHGDFNQHNILFENSSCAILNFERAGYGMQIMDLGNFMRKILEKHGWDVGIGMGMIREYEKERILSVEDRLQLFCRLSYPEKFWKLANRYYGSRKVWVSGQSIEKLRKEIRQNEARCRYLEYLKEILT